uniref:Uncharacterized protein n=1 Tax=viral metagenome TaxID=1070528 RepID=A0A6C0AZL9_9ZZZZ
MDMLYFVHFLKMDLKVKNNIKFTFLTCMLLIFKKMTIKA